MRAARDAKEETSKEIIAMGTMKHVVRVGVIGALIAGAGLAIAGGPRVKAVMNQARHNINVKIDQNITDPVALRAQLRDLEGQYPQRIAEVRSDLTELREQIAQLNREQEVNERVVALADTDLDQINSALAQAEEASFVQVASDGEPKRIVICFKSDRLSVEDAYGRANEITNTRNAYASRADDIERDLGYLSQQEERLLGLLNKLETERQTFQAQLWDLDRKVDAVARNDRMIDIMEKRQQTIDEQSRYRAGSLDQITSRLADIKAKQESKLAALASDHNRVNYEDMAKSQIDRELSKNRKVKVAERKPKPEVIEIRPATEDAKQEQKEEGKKETLAQRD
jgi:hypothetical protein